ncbi:type II toxin-antitoxin system RelE/ParE family toxin [Candidatus Bathyarchaeota archaeon]|nr:MAG: type II toxin-antitoxin system RelE/ParE family toxin [Candidatus Bathyarchaeota archaeon]RLI19310.1 MAG: hypothetical protein DRO49_00770 [Candidatus Bathyarchaeota archaeon]
MTKYEIYLEHRAAKQLRRLRGEIQSRIVESLRILGEHGFTARLNIKKLRGYRNHYRLRIGEYRILFEFVRPRRIIVYAILHRRRAYSTDVDKAT